MTTAITHMRHAGRGAAAWLNNDHPRNHPQTSNPTSKKRLPQEDQGPPKFTTREKDVLNLLVQDQANKEIASRLSICEKTVEFHLAKIYAKLGVTNRTQAVAKAIQLGIGEN